MAIDASIPLQVQPVQVADPIAARAKLFSLQAAMGQQQMQQQQIQEGQYRLNDLKQQQSDQSAVRNALSNASVSNPDGTVSLNRTAALGELYKSAPTQALQLSSTWAAQDMALKKADLESQKAQNDVNKQRVEALGQLAGGVTDQASYDRAKAIAVQQGLIHPGDLPAVYDPQLISQTVTNALSAKDNLDAREKALTLQLNAQKAAEDARHNKATEGFTASAQAETRRHDRADEGNAAFGNVLKGKELDLKGKEIAATVGQKQVAEESQQRAQFEHVTEPFRIQTQAYNEALAAVGPGKKPTAASDRALVNAALAIQNPRGTARPGQAAQSLDPTGAGNALGAAINRITNGSLLSDTQRQQIVKTLTDQYKLSEQQHMQNVTSSRNIATRAGLNPDNVAPEYRSVVSPNNSTVTGRIRARDADGVLHEAPVGTPLPPGWKAE